MSAPREHPVLFNGAMVRAIIDGKKTVTRRPVDHTNSIVNGYKRWNRQDFARFPLDKAWVDKGPSPAGNPGPYLKCDSTHPDDDGAMARLYPPWQVGERLWVRECWAYEGNDDGVPTGNYFYRADTKPADYGLCELPDGRVFDGPWRPSLHMHRTASRLTLEIARIRAERVQDITEDDARAEGAENMGVVFRNEPATTFHPELSGYRGGFACLWEQVYGAGAWERNGWVWAIDFKVVTT